VLSEFCWGLFVELEDAVGLLVLEDEDFVEILQAGFLD
jgi:hypothetical protein